MTRAPALIPNGTGADTPAKGRSIAARYVLGILMLTYTSAWIDRGVLAVLAQPIKVDLKLSDWQIGLLTGPAFAMVYSVLGFPMARLCERFNRVKVISICLIVWSGMTALSAIASGYGMLLILRCGVGIGEAGCGPASHALLTDYFAPPKRTMALSVYGMGVPLGMLIGSIAGGWIAQHYGWRTALAIVGLPGLAVALLVRLTVREPARGLSDVSIRSIAPSSARDVWAVLFSKPTFRHMLAGLVIFSIGMSGINAFIAPYYSRRFGFEYASVGLIVGAVTSLAGVAGTLAGGYIAQQSGRRNPRGYLLTPAIGIALSAAFLLIALAQNRWQTLAWLTLMAQISSAAYMAPVFAVTHNMVDAGMRATAAATLFFFLNMIGMSLGPLFVGGLSDVLSAHFFSGAIPFGTACPGGAAVALAPLAAANACRKALADGTNVTLMLCTPIILWGAVHYYLASRTIAKDLKAAVPA